MFQTSRAYVWPLIGLYHLTRNNMQNISMLCENVLIKQII